MLLSTSVSFAAPARRAAPRRSVAARAAAPKKKEEVRFLPCRGGGVVLSARSWHGVSAVEGPLSACQQTLLHFSLVLTGLPAEGGDGSADRHPELVRRLHVVEGRARLRRWLRGAQVSLTDSFLQADSSAERAQVGRAAAEHQAAADEEEVSRKERQRTNSGHDGESRAEPGCSWTLSEICAARRVSTRKSKVPHFSVTYPLVALFLGSPL